MKNLLALFFIFIAFAANSQFYYNDILSVEELNLRMKNFRDNKINSVNATAFSPEGVKNTDFIELQEVKENGKLLKISSFSENVKTTGIAR